MVDDVPEMRRHLCDLLSALEIQGVEAGNGVEALELLASGNFDLIFTDLVMPEMDGFELCEEVRRQPQIRHLPIIATSNHRDTRYVIRALRRGADDYLTKPTSSPLIERVIARVLSDV